MRRRRSTSAIGRAGPPRGGTGRWRRSLHFVALGAALFAVQQLRPMAPAPAVSAPRPTVTIAAAQVALLRADFARALGRPPSAAEERAMLDRAIDEELLYREALALGLDRGDRSVDWRLAEKMRFLTGEEEGGDVARQAAEARALGLDRDDPVLRRQLIHKLRLLPRAAAAEAAADSGALAAFYERHGERYRQPGTVSLSHVFLSRARHGAALEERAGELLAVLQRAGDGEAAAGVGEPFAGGHTVAASSPQQLRKRFGDAFAAAVPDLPVGRWSGPLASPYGLHLVYVRARQPARLPPLAAVAPRVQRQLAAELRRERLAALLAALWAKYDVRVESTDGPAA